jgi:hypothetical protein
MRSQVRFVMHPTDERVFESVVVADTEVRFIDGPRWKTQVPESSATLTGIGHHCIIWSPNDFPQMHAKYIPACNDWHCESEYATIQFLRSGLTGALLTEGRIAIASTPSYDLPETVVARLDQRFKFLRKHIVKTYTNSIVQWRNPTLPYASAVPGRSANPSKPDPQVWIGPHALHWLREQPDRRIKQFHQSVVEAILVPERG